jgi:hypothetical protein
VFQTISKWLLGNRPPVLALGLQRYYRYEKDAGKAYQSVAWPLNIFLMFELLFLLAGLCIPAAKITVSMSGEDMRRKEQARNLWVQREYNRRKLVLLVGSRWGELERQD